MPPTRQQPPARPEPPINDDGSLSVPFPHCRGWHTDQPQLLPLVRVHSETGTPALYLCEAGQLDWVDRPIADLSPGPDGEGAELVYTHDWRAGDLVIYDNRCTLHCATWFDADKHNRLMWRTTTWGNPGPEYAGER